MPQEPMIGRRESSRPDAPRGPATKFVWNAIVAGNQGPGRRSRHSFAYDTGRKAIVLFGGIDWAAGGALLGDTWEFHTRRWSRVRTPDRPPARHRGAMVYSPQAGYSILFGGQGHEGWRFPLLNDTWTYANQEWSRWGKVTFTRPPARCGHAFAFDETAGVAVLFGGIARHDKPLGDTWVFDGRSWRAIKGAGPAPRRYAALAYDPELQGCVLNGGSEDDHGRRSFGDTWLFRNETWQRMATSLDLPACDDHALAYHHAAKSLVMFGGLGRQNGFLVRVGDAWRMGDAWPMPPRHQCAPLVWSDDLNGLVLYGGEARHAGPQFDTTWLLACDFLGNTPTPVRFTCPRCSASLAADSDSLPRQAICPTCREIFQPTAAESNEEPVYDLREDGDPDSKKALPQTIPDGNPAASRDASGSTCAASSVAAPRARQPSGSPTDVVRAAVGVRKRCQEPLYSLFPACKRFLTPFPGS